LTLFLVKVFLTWVVGGRRNRHYVKDLVQLQGDNISQGRDNAIKYLEDNPEVAKTSSRCVKLEMGAVSANSVAQSAAKEEMDVRQKNNCQLNLIGFWQSSVISRNWIGSACLRSFHVTQIAAGFLQSTANHNYIDYLHLDNTTA